MGVARLVATLTVAASLLGAVGAATAADRRASAASERSTVDGGMAVYVAGTGASAGGVAVAAWRLTRDTTYASDVAGARTSSTDTVIVCVSYGSKRWEDSGCTVLPPAAVTTGAVLPETVPIRVRVPSSRHRGEWLEADVLLRGTGSPRVPPAGGSWDASLPSGVPSSFGRYANVTVALIREAEVTGTVRTSRTPAQRPARVVLSQVVRATVTNNSAGARTTAEDAAILATPALRELAARGG